LQGRWQRLERAAGRGWIASQRLRIREGDRDGIVVGVLLAQAG
jgi:hypothetical protein